MPSSSQADTSNYILLGVSRDTLTLEVAKQARELFHGPGKLVHDYSDTIDRTVKQIAAPGVLESLPMDRPLTFSDMLKAGAMSVRLANIIINEALMEQNLADIGVAKYSALKTAPNAGQKSILELMTIVEAHRQSDGFARAGNPQPQPAPDDAARAAEKWKRLTVEQQERAIGRLVTRLGDPEFAAAVMGPILALIEPTPKEPALPQPGAAKGPRV